MNELTKTFYIPRNSRSSKIRVKVRLWAGDSWNAGENVYLKLNTDVDTDPSPKVVAYAENCLWGFDKSDADVQPSSADKKNGWKKYFEKDETAKLVVKWPCHKPRRNLVKSSKKPCQTSQNLHQSLTKASQSTIEVTLLKSKRCFIEVSRALVESKF